MELPENDTRSDTESEFDCESYFPLRNGFVLRVGIFVAPLMTDAVVFVDKNPKLALVKYLLLAVVAVAVVVVPVANNPVGVCKLLAVTCCLAGSCNGEHSSVLCWLCWNC